MANRCGGVVQVPLTSRDAPRAGGDLVGELELSVLGHRWVYLATSDPVHVAEATAVIREGRGEVEILDDDGSVVPRRATTASVRGSGAGSGRLHVAVAIVPGPAQPDVPGPAQPDVPGTVTATWAEQPDPVVLAWLSED